MEIWGVELLIKGGPKQFMVEIEIDLRGNLKFEGEHKTSAYYD